MLNYFIFLFNNHLYIHSSLYIFTHYLQQLNPPTKEERGLLPYEIQKILDEELNKKKIIDLYSDKFKELLREFISSKVKSLIKTRAAFKLSPCDTENSIEEDVDRKKL